MNSKDKKSEADSAQNTNPTCYKDATELAVLMRTKQISSMVELQSHADF
jgi:hypothetical protein